MRPKVEVFGSTSELARRFAEVLMGQVTYAVEHRSKASIAFSRPTPEDVFAEVGELVRLPTGRVQIFQVDERYSSQDDDQRNHNLIRRHLKRLLEESAYFPMRTSDALDTNRKRYDKLIEEQLGSSPAIDFIHLGLGTDGHTASLMPGDPVLEVKDRSVATTKAYDGTRRWTLTYPMINAARLIVFVVVGRDKADAVQRVMREEKTAPAARIENDNVLFLLDQEAAGRL
jgi:6-phosphogluconolactonase